MPQVFGRKEDLVRKIKEQVHEIDKLKKEIELLKQDKQELENALSNMVSRDEQPRK